jgi:hypothetical protein
VTDQDQKAGAARDAPTQGRRLGLSGRMELKQPTLEEIVDSERSLVLGAEARYGKYYLNARDCSIFLSRSIVSVELSHHDTFGRFFSQLKKHHMLALLSTVRLHKVQSMMNLRQVLEAGAAAAFAIANPEMQNFADTAVGLLDPSKALAKKRYEWLDKHFPDGSRAIKEKKELINYTTSHANIVSANLTFSVDDKMTNIAAPFFDIEDEYHVQVDLWLISSIGVELMDLLYGVNLKRNAIEFIENFPDYLHRVARRTAALRAEIKLTDRYERAMAIARRGAAGKSSPGAR